jgi:transcriptional regulator with XRE-family HTH domain
VCIIRSVFIQEIRVDPERLRKARGSRSPSVVATELGITRQRLWQIENGNGVPSGDVLARMCELYGKEIKELVLR